VIDSIKEHIRILDFDASQSESVQQSTKRPGIHKAYGYTRGYVSPEIYKEETSQIAYQSEKQKLDSGKSDVYSFGILALIILGVINPQKLKDLDAYKMNEKWHKDNIISLIDNLKIENRKMLEINLKFILRMCLEFDPERRIDFKSLDKIMKMNFIEKVPELEFKNKVLNIMVENLLFEKEKTNIKLQNIEKKLIYLNKACSEIDEELSRIKQTKNFNLNEYSQFGNQIQKNFQLNQSQNDNLINSNVLDRLSKYKF